MEKVFGDLSSLKQSEKRELEKLARRKTHPQELISQELLRAACLLANQLERQIGIMIERRGEVYGVVLGSKNRIYLPDLDKFKRIAGKLCRIRLIVVAPQSNCITHKCPEELMVHSYPDYVKGGVKARGKTIVAPQLPEDLFTDLDKLRLDMVAMCIADDAEHGAVSVIHLDTILRTAETEVLKQGARKTNLSFLCYTFRNIFECDLDVEILLEEVEERIAVNASKYFTPGLERAILVGVYNASEAEIEYAVQEMLELARTDGLAVVDNFIQRRRAPDPKTVIGKGKIEELSLRALDLEADILLFDCELSPGQLRSITKATSLRVIDRSILILDIFAQRAKTSEGKLQVELAQLKYSLPRLTERDSGLSRLTGGIGGRGPGETKLEIGRRRVRDRIVELEKRINRISEQRAVRRQLRQGRGIPVVAIVGYTNSGKSTLLNALTKGDVFVENKLFATLDPASRRMRFPNGEEVIFVDTVGFIRELPDELVSAFRATLEEVGEADLLIHLADISNPEVLRQINVVNKTLEEIGLGEKPKMLVFNKSDMISEIEATTVKHSCLASLTVSAAKRTGFGELILGLQNSLASLKE